MPFSGFREKHDGDIHATRKHLRADSASVCFGKAHHVWSKNYVRAALQLRFGKRPLLAVTSYACCAAFMQREQRQKLPGGTGQGQADRCPARTVPLIRILYAQSR